MTTKTTVIFLRGVQRSLQQKFKRLCKKEGQTMKGRILQLIEKDVKKPPEKFLTMDEYLVSIGHPPQKAKAAAEEMRRYLKSKDLPYPEIQK